jgi:hypothetical protein
VFLLLLVESALALELDLRTKARWSMEERPTILSLKLQGDRLHVCATTNGLYVVDVSRPEFPRTIGRYDSPGRASGLALDGDTAYLADDSGGLRILDMADPTRPRPIGHFAGATNVYRVAVQGRHLYLADIQRGLLILDVGNPTSPMLLAEVPLQSGAVDVALGSDHAFLAGRAAGVGIVDIRDPARPTLVTNLDLGSVTTVATSLSGSTLYAGAYGRGFAIVDVSAPTQPRLMTNQFTPPQAFCTGLDHAAGLVGMADPAGTFHLFREVAPAAIDYVGRFWLESAQAVAMDSRHAFVASSQGFVDVVGLDEPARPVAVAQVPVGAGSVLFAEQPGALHVARFSLLTTFDVSVPDGIRPTWTNRLSSSFPLTSRLLEFPTHGRLGFLSPGPRTTVLDLSVPTRPEVLVDSPNSLTVRPLVAGEAGVFLAVGGRLEWWDYSDPQNPIRVAASTNAGTYSSLRVHGDHIYAFRREGGLEIHHARRGDGLVLLSTAATEGSGRLALSGDRLVLVQDVRPFVVVLSLADPANPSRLGFFPGDHGFGSFVVRDGFLYGVPLFESFNGSGVEVLDLGDPAAIRRVGGNAIPATQLVSDGLSLFCLVQDRVLVFPLVKRTAVPRWSGMGVREGRSVLQIEGEPDAFADIERSDTLGGWRRWRSVGLPQGTATVEDDLVGPTSFYRIAPR